MDRRIERTRAAVVAATVALVADRGAQVGMTEIADAAGVSRKAVYENFGSRDQVLRSTTESLLHEVPLEPEAAQAGGRSPWDAVLPPIARHVEQFRSFYRAVLSGPGCFMVRDAVVDEQRGTAAGGDAGECDRFIVHGLVGVISDSLVQHLQADLQGLVRQLTSGLAASVSC